MVRTGHSGKAAVACFNKQPAWDQADRQTPPPKGSRTVSMMSSSSTGCWLPLLLAVLRPSAAAAVSDTGPTLRWLPAPIAPQGRRRGCSGGGAGGGGDDTSLLLAAARAVSCRPVTDAAARAQTAIGSARRSRRQAGARCGRQQQIGHVCGRSKPHQVGCVLSPTTSPCATPMSRPATATVPDCSAASAPHPAATCSFGWRCSSKGWRVGTGSAAGFSPRGHGMRSLSNGTATAFVGPRGLIDRCREWVPRWPPPLGTAALPPRIQPTCPRPRPSPPRLAAGASTCGCWSRRCGRWGMPMWPASWKPRAAWRSSRRTRLRSARRCCGETSMQRSRWRQLARHACSAACMAAC